jgi:hypothetical protein
MILQLWMRRSTLSVVEWVERLFGSDERKSLLNQLMVEWGTR